MAFSLKTWVNRISEYPNRRKLTHEDGSTELVTVARAEGQISAEGNAFSAEEMNDLENRIKGGFDEVNQSLNKLNEGIEWKRNDEVLQREDCEIAYIEYTKFLYNKLHAEATFKLNAKQAISKGTDIIVAKISDSKFNPKTTVKDISYTGIAIGALYIENGYIKYRQLIDTMPKDYAIIFTIRWDLF